MAFDYKKEYKEFYLPTKTPGIIDVPPINYIAVRGSGNPNDDKGEYKTAIGLLYGIAFTIKMSEKSNHKIPGYFSYVVPPLEGLWWQEGNTETDSLYHFYPTRKENFRWISMIRLPEFVTKEEFEWAVQEASAKKKIDYSKVEFFSYNEGLCVQCMHIGSYDNEAATIEQMEAFIRETGYAPDFQPTRLYHEIYLSDPRRTATERLKTVIRIPVRKITI